MARRVVIFGWAESVHVQRWAEGLAGQGYEVKVISLGGSPVQGCETVIFPRRSRWSYITQARRAAAAARRFAPDLVHCHYATGFGLWAILSRVKPLVVSAWGSDIVDFPTRHFGRTAVKAVLKRATHITATSQFLRHMTIKLCPEIKDRVSIIPFGVTMPEEVKPPPPSPPVRLCYIKSHHVKYGPDILLRALLKVRKEFPEVRLSIAGKGELTPELLWQTTNLGLDDIVDYVGMLPKEQMYDFLSRHHVMVMPTIVSESFGVAALEAGACGLPVVASWAGGVPEVICRGETGLLVPPGEVDMLAEALLRLCRDAELREQLGRNAREFVRERYSWDRSLEMMTQLYERLIDEQKG